MDHFEKKFLHNLLYSKGYSFQKRFINDLLNFLWTIINSK